MIKIVIENRDVNIGFFVDKDQATEWLMVNMDEWDSGDKICFVDFEQNTCEFFEARIELMKLD
jgi:hypothetical protein